MSITELLAFTAATFIASVIPGPAIFTAIACTMTRGLHSTLIVMAGLTSGDLVYFAFAIFGLAGIAAIFGELFIVIKYAGAAYLAYLGWSLFTRISKKAVREQIRHNTGRNNSRNTQSYLAGLLITLSNPKTMVFFIAVLPGGIDLRHVDTVEILLLGTIIALLSFGCALAYCVFALLASRSVKTRIPTRWINYTAGSVLFGCSAAIATRD